MRSVRRPGAAELRRAAAEVGADHDWNNTATQPVGNILGVMQMLPVELD